MIARLNRQNSSSGFTITELIVSSTILVMATAGALLSYQTVQRGERVHSVQGELDIDARHVVERLRRDLWRTSRDRILLYPPGPGPYSAISFPLIDNLDPNAPVPRDADGMIEWDSTIIYHFWAEGRVPELRITTFSPRADLGEAQRVEQLAHVVKNGRGTGASNGSNAETRTLIRNLVEWELNIIRSRFDAYAPAPGRRSHFSLGSALLTDGPQRYTFRVADRNPASSGFRFGLDTLTVSPTVARREAHEQFPLQGFSGGTPWVTYNPDGIWSGNHYLDFSASGEGAELSFSLRHDRWEERNFHATGVRLDDTQIDFDTELTPHQYVVRLVGNDKVWEAVDQTGDMVGEPQADPDLMGTAVRVLLRGDDLLPGGLLKFSGENAWVGFRAAGPTESGHTRALFIRNAFIAESAGGDNPMNYIDGTQHTIRFNDLAYTLVYTRRESDKIAISIQEDKSYVIGYRVLHFEGLPWGYGWVWTPPEEDAAPSSYVIPASSSPTLSDLLAPTWSTRTDLEARGEVLAVEYVHVGHPAEGTYTSPVFDTHVNNPQYSSLIWDASVPDESVLEMRIRTGDADDLSDAPDWDAVSTRTSGQALNENGRYAQVQARLLPGIDSRSTPRLKNFILDWAGPTQIVDIAVSGSVGPDHGIVELLVNDAPLFQGVTVDLTVFKDVQMGAAGTRRLTSSVLTEIIPRNTGK